MSRGPSWQAESNLAAGHPLRLPPARLRQCVRRAASHRPIDRIDIQFFNRANDPWYTKLLIKGVSSSPSNEWWFDFKRFDRCADGFDSVNRIYLPRSPDGPAAVPQNIKLPMTARIERPLSPHMQIYRWTLTMALSIVHRATGIALYFGTLLLAWWLIAAASGPGAYANVQAFTGSIIGKLIVFGYTWALIHHLLSGLRHFVWDLGYGFKANEREALTWGALIGGISLTVLVWIIAYTVGGGR
jgi:succinate dehydrogenase / fumarate reductase cytochrome b subunit